MKLDKYFIEIGLFILTTVVSIQPDLSFIINMFKYINDEGFGYLAQIYVLYPFLYPWLTISIGAFFLWLIVSIIFKIVEK